MDANTGPLVGDVHSNGGDIDSLLSNDKDGRKEPVRRLHEPYDRHRAHDLRAECYRRGIRPIKKGPNANDNKSGYIDLLRQNDGPILKAPSTQINKREDEETEDEEDASNGGDHVHEVEIITNMTNKRKISTMTMQTQTETNNLKVTSAAVADLQGFYEGGPSILPMQYSPNLPKPSANPTTDLEILSGIANSYTQNGTADGQLCNNCRTVVTDQLMESIRLGKTKMQLEEWHKLMDQRDRDTLYLKQVLEILQNLRKSFREAQVHGMNHDLLVELQDDMAFFQNLKEQTKERMRQAMHEARERSANKSNAMA
ncbi:unnamed protein product [Peronospora farinosa]|uniref:Uncharacterized protein n=1 Tax=Peronospora farinosa TaxID=134698 RepID=A0AAV0UFD4_9STRA|nr:unnamed protein product [Peronospora farinosa]CAI5734155.1 unnamed protein product [Peronospora farinosa]